ncbi:rho guanine nucleotide exchange factor 25-like [Musca autumnalis]|uniref:rho guanine nucleotide exchange factor 25-like n=1 Tax=Musca autumnalis TaxID=221902 RepID=UPI003CF338F0
MARRSQRNSTSLGKLETTLSELVKTEEAYIEQLSCIVNGYLREFRKTIPQLTIPDDLRGYKGRFIFCNIEQIFQWHRDSFSQILKYYRHATSELGTAILKCDADLQMYAKYCNNLPTAQCILRDYKEYFKEVQEKLKLKWQLCDLLISPAQRLAAYESFISSITDNLREVDADWESMEKAHEMILKVQKHINDFSALEDMKNFNGDIYDHGKLLFQEYLHCKYDGKKRLHYVFLFTRLLVFTDRQNSKEKDGIPSYTCCLQIPMNKLHMKVLSKKEFSLNTTDPNKKCTPIICQGSSKEVHNLWLMQLQSQLQIQAELVAYLEYPTEEETNREVAI